ncbi:MAG TPA: pteridine reductase [Steroidobacteraceae bacterium]|jgi:pteridine reductase|nr:pteridine reductase [Steroidobacteraceae bacterium]
MTSTSDRGTIAAPGGGPSPEGSSQPANEYVPGAVSLSGRTALVTGAARRVGAAIVRALHAAGANVVIHCHHSVADARALAAELERARAGSTAVAVADLLDVKALPALVGAATGRFGALHLLVNNASSFFPTPLGQMTAAQWEDLIGTNLRAPLFLAQAAASALRLTRGSVVNIVDIHGQRPLRDHAIYCTAKAGLIMLTRALARELAPEVRVNAIAPGAILWPESGMDETRKQRITAQTPLQRHGSPQDIARAVLFFSAEAPFVTGQILAVDGGRSVGW